MGEDTNRLDSDEQSVSPVIGVILMVAITVILAAVVGVFATGIGGELNKVSGNVGVDFEESPVGLEMTVETVSTDAAVRINGETIATIDEDDTGRTVLLPTAPGDRVTVVSGNDQQSVLVDKTADDRSEIGDFIGYYEFEDESTPNEVTDLSNQGNTLDLTDPGATYTDDGAVDFTHQTGGAADTSLSGPLGDPTTEVTVLMSVQLDQPGAGGGNAGHAESMRLRVNSNTDDGSQIDFDHEDEGGGEYTTDFISNEGDLSPSDQQEFDSKHVYAVTIGADTMRAYIDGQNVGERNHDEKVRPKEFFIANEAPGQEEMDGKVYEARIYHDALSEEAIEAVSSLMEPEE